MQSITAYENDSDTNLEEFVAEHLSLVKKIALFIKRKLPSHIEFDDLLQSGLIGLLEAKRNYNPEMGASFETFASIRIRGAIIDYLRKNSWASRDTMRAMKIMSEAISKIEQREQREATAEDIMKELSLSAKEYAKMNQEINMLHVASLDKMHIDYILVDDDEDPEKITQKEDIKAELKNALSSLPKKEQMVLSLYYVDELTFKQIGEVLELTEARICQIHSHAITKIRSKMKTD